MRFKLLLLYFLLYNLSNEALAQMGDNANADILQENKSVKIDLESSVVPQTKFDFSFKRDALLLGGGIALAVSGQLIKNSVAPLTDAEILALDRSTINAFDRGATYQNKARDGTISDYLLGFSLVAPFSVLASRSVRQEVTPILMMYLETGTLVAGLTNISKGLVQRTRPLAYNDDFTLSYKRRIGTRHSFFSGHTSTSAAFMFLTASMVQHYADKPAWKYAAWSGAVVIPGTIAYLRYSAGKHFPSDVLVGYAVGAGCGLLIPALHRAELPKDISFSIHPTPYGVLITARF